MSDNLLTPEFRAAFISVFRATKPKGAEASQENKYSIRAAFSPTADMSALKKAAAQAAAEKWGDTVPKTMRSPFRRNDELENPVPGIGDDWIVMTFSAKEGRRPGIVDAGLNDIIDETQVYSGAFYRAQVRAVAYERPGNKGVSFWLQNVQKLRDGDPLGGSNVPASKAFTAVEGAGPKSADDIF